HYKTFLSLVAAPIRQLPLPAPCHFLRSTSVREEVAGSVRTDIVYSAEIPYEGRNILLLEGGVDTGITLNFLVDHIREREPHTALLWGGGCTPGTTLTSRAPPTREREPQSLKVCALVDKPRERKID